MKRTIIILLLISATLVSAQTLTHRSAGNFTVSWSPVTGASMYLVRLARFSDSTNVVEAEDTTSSPAYSYSSIAQGRYIVGVRAIVSAETSAIYWSHKISSIKSIYIDVNTTRPVQKW